MLGKELLFCTRKARDRGESARKTPLRRELPSQTEKIQADGVGNPSPEDCTRTSTGMEGELKRFFQSPLDTLGRGAILVAMTCERRRPLGPRRVDMRLL